jgi:nucleoid-associated protein YgaU
MWIPLEKRFKMGSTCPDPAMDTSAWGVQALGLEYASTMEFAEKTFLRTRTAKASGKSVTAYSDFKDKDRIWLEGSGEMAVAWHLTGNRDKARSTLREIENALIPSERFPGAAGIPCHTNDPAWETGADRIFVPSQAWYLYGVWEFNPMDPSQHVMKIHVVKPGETLSKIAGYGHIYGDPAKWRKIFEANRSTLASVDQIRPGQKLVIP